jgi:ABC-type transport system involved in multi-copper enzyme maturation permease subunit
MTLTLRHLATIARITMLEGARKQIFHVLMLFAMTLIIVATLLGFLDHNVQIKIVKDLCSVAILISSSIIAITLSVSGLPQEIEQRTVYPYLAKPIRRWEFVVGKYLGTMGTVAIGMGIMLAAFAAILIAYSHGLDLGVFMVIPYLFLQAAILAAVALLFSTLQLSGFITSHDQSVIGRFLGTLMVQILPNLECFNFKDAMIHGRPVSGAYLAQTALYGIVYTLALLTLSSLNFARKEL